MVTTWLSGASSKCNTPLKFYQTHNMIFYPNHLSLATGSEAHVEKSQWLLLLKLQKYIHFSSPVTIQYQRQTPWQFTSSFLQMFTYHDPDYWSVHEEVLDNICLQGWAYGGVDWWCFVKDQVLPIMYKCLCLAISKTSTSTTECHPDLGVTFLE